MNKLSQRLKSQKLLPFATAALLLFASFLLRWLALGQTPYGNGWDAYFYLVQLKAWLEEGSMHSQDLSLIYPYMLLFKAFIADYVLAYKAGAAFLAALFSLSVFALAYKLSGRRYAPALVLGAFTLFSPELTYFAAQYPKNLLGLLFLLWLMYVADNWKLALLLLLLGFFGHRMTALLGMGYIATYYLLRFGKLRPLLIVAGIGLAFLALGILLPGLLSFYDWERLEGFLSPQPQLLLLSFQDTLSAAAFSPFWQAELWLSGFFLVVALAYLLYRKAWQAREMALILLALLLIFPFYSWSTEGIAFRFVQVFILLSPLLLIPLLAQLENAQRKVFSLMAALLAVLALFSWKSYEPVRHDPPYALYRYITGRALHALKGEEAELVIAHKGLAEFFTFSSGLDAMPWEPEYAIAPEKLWRISAGFEKQELVYALGQEGSKMWALGMDYTLLPESSWQQILKQWQQEENKELLEEAQSWRNPFTQRPAYLLKNK